MIEFSTIYPVYVAEELAALKVFYNSVFGFNAVFFDPDFYLHLQNPKSGAEIGFLVPRHASQPEFLHAKAQVEGMVLSFEVVDAKAALAAVQQAGLDIVLPYTEETWGQRHFMLRDPAGFILDIIEKKN